MADRSETVGYGWIRYGFGTGAVQQRLLARIGRITVYFVNEQWRRLGKFFGRAKIKSPLELVCFFFKFIKTHLFKKKKFTKIVLIQVK